MAKPNILVLMVDQLTGTLFPDGPAEWLHAPNLRRLAERSVRFATCYTAAPLCAPGRASFMSGQLPRRTRVYDNAAEFASDTPTFAHHLRRAGYATCLCGKMHFVGPDQLHGFEERLTTDIYPADFGWTPDYRRPGERIAWWYHTLGSVVGAGVAEVTNQLDYDDEVAHHAVQKLHDLGRADDGRPWMLTVSFTHPHDPYVARARFWDLYADCEHLAPRVPDLGYAAQDPHSRRILRCQRLAELRDRRGARPSRPAGLFRQHLLHRRQDRRGPRGAGGDADGGGHDRALHLRSRRHARRAGAVVQDELLRGLGAGAADDRGARVSRRGGWRRRSARST